MNYNANYEFQYQPRAFAMPGITWAVRLLILANITVFAAQLLVHVPLGRHPAELPGGNPVWWFSFQPMLWWCVWKPLTYQFLHSGLLHLFLNMLWLFIFGPDVERTLGSRGFIKFYVICGAVAVLFTMPAYIIGANSGAIPIVGASGAVMAVLVAFAMIDPNRQFFLFPLPFPITARGIVVIVIVLNVIQSLGNSGVSVETHFGGMIAGFLYIKFLPKIMDLYRERIHNKGKSEEKMDKLGEAVDNIFDMDDWRKR